MLKQVYIFKTTLIKGLQINFGSIGTFLPCQLHHIRRKFVTLLNYLFQPNYAEIILYLKTSTE